MQLSPIHLQTMNYFGSKSQPGLSTGAAAALICPGQNVLRETSPEAGRKQISNTPDNQCTIYFLQSLPFLLPQMHNTLATLIMSMLCH